LPLRVKSHDTTSSEGTHRVSCAARLVMLITLNDTQKRPQLVVFVMTLTHPPSAAYRWVSRM